MEAGAVPEVEHMVFDVGVDAGSVSVNAVVIGREGSIVLETPYLRHFGLVVEEAGRLLGEIFQSPLLGRDPEIRSVTFTGVHGQRLAEVLEAPYEVETIAQVVGVLRVAPGVRTIISMGGQDAALFQISHVGEAWHLEAFNMNGPCASGTGSFIDQQAERLAQSLYGADFVMDQGKFQKTLEDFIALGLQSTTPAPVACRCTVFTKSDMIHLQNKGETLPNIIAGLHYGNAANTLSTLVGNRALADPMVMVGGMASNGLQVQAFRHYFPRIQVPPHHTSLGALGAALQARRHGWRNTVDLSRLDRESDSASNDGAFPRTEPLDLHFTRFDADNSLPPLSDSQDSPINAFLGVDIGSTSTKYALIDEAGRIIHKCYRPTQGKPITVARQLLQTLLSEAGGRVEILAIATTGSGRQVVGDFLGADLVIDEITAHARGGVAVDPRIDTIFEIGGQDSKYIRIENTHPLDFDMNKVCAAGTGSFLHELANKMRINIVEEFQRIALSAETPVALAERCTVFMESDLVSYAQKGARRRDLIAGLCYAIVHNYLNRVVEKRAVGERIMFLGGPSLNQGIVAAFERVLKRPILVPKHREVMGAYGAALTLSELWRKGEIRRNEAHDLVELAERPSHFTESVCRADRKCHNECKLKVYQFGEHKSIWGGDCGRYDVSRHAGPPEINLFLERQRLFQEALTERGVLTAGWDGVEGGSKGGSPGGSAGPVVGVPLSLHTLDWGLLWTHLFADLGWTVLLSPPTNNRLALAGVECMTSETCFPVKVFHGHVRHLLDRAEFLFLPNVIDMPTPHADERGLFCPLVESAQYMVRAALDIPPRRMIRPTLNLKEGADALVEPLLAALPASIRPTRKHLARAVADAWDRQMQFRQDLLARGRNALESTPPNVPLWIVTGRPYNLHDERLNLQLGRHLAKLGIRAVPMDYLDVDGEDLSDFPRMYWGLGAKILRAAKRIARTPNWYGVHLTNFSCGADSFLEHFYRHILGAKASLILELDEHSAVAGVLTRIEAYRNVVKNLQEKR